MRRTISALQFLIFACACWLSTGVYAPRTCAGAEDAAPKTYTFKTVNDLKIEADVYRLPGEEVRPVIVWIHGGALISGQRDGLRADQRQRYLQAGYVVVSIDYRLAPETKLKGIIEDLQDAFTWVSAQGPVLFKINSKQVAVIGHSAGGYLTLMTGFAVQPRPQVLVAFYGYGDTDVPHQQSVDMAKELRRVGVAHDVVSLKGYGHGFDGKGLQDAKVAASFDQVMKFLQTHCPPR